VPGIEPGTSACIARNSDHLTTEAVSKISLGSFIQLVYAHSKLVTQCEEKTGHLAIKDQVQTHGNLSGTAAGFSEISYSA
jgi:hypothetical protein